MNKITFFTIVLVSTLISCNAQKTQERTVSPFNRMKISGGVHVVYTNSDTLTLSVRAKENELDNVQTKIENSTLYISSTGHITSPVYVFVKNNNLSSLESSGATAFKTTNTLTGDSVEFYSTGASDIKATINMNKITCTEDGASNVVIKGSTGQLTAHLSGASTLKSYDLVSKNAVLVTSGAANAKVYVTEKLQATATSASDIKVKGDPKEVVAETSTAASITRIKEVSEKSGKQDGDTTSYNLKKRKILVVKGSGVKYNDCDTSESSFYHWKGFSMGVNGYMSPAGGIKVPTQYNYMDLDYRRSLNFQFNLFESQIKLVRHNMKLVTGFGFDYHLYELANKTTLNADSSFTWGTVDSTGQYSYKKNKLRCTYIQVPLLLEFNTSNDPDKAFHIAVGVVGQFLISSRTKQVLEEGRDKTTNVRKDGYNMSPFAAKAHVNVGYRGWTFFGEYSLTPLFQSGKGPELYPFTVGVRVLPFS